MKKLLFGLIATIIVSNLSFAQEVIKPSEYGFYHNEAVKVYNENYLQGNISKMNGKDAKQVITDLLTLMKQKHPKQFENVKISEYLQYFETPAKGNFDFFENWKNNKEIYIKNGFITKKVSLLLDDVIANGKDYKSIMNIVEVFKANNQLDENEKKCITVFQSVIENSNTLWYESNTFGKKNPCTPRTIIADAATSAMFFYGGPFGILAGAASSLFVYYSDSSC